ncbi:MAG: hypothetical protein ABR607_02205 [Pyrinomonadaceae bacterium]
MEARPRFPGRGLRSLPTKTTKPCSRCRPTTALLRMKKTQTLS